MKRIIFTFTLIACLSYGTRSNAQESLTTLSYSMGLGVGNTGDFISKYSWRGFGFEYRYLSQPHVGAGINLGWNTFYQEMPFATYTFETISASGYQFRYLNSFPIMAAGDYYFKPEEKLNPYVGIGLGVQYIVQTVDFGIYRFESDGWPFTFAPEVGVLIQSPNGPAFNVGIKFMYAVKSSDLEAQTDLLFNVGLVFGN